MRTVIEHAWILTMDPENTCYKDGYIIIEDSKILKTGEGESPLQGDRCIDAGGAILMPGMVNVHSHVPMIPFRTMGDDCQDRLRRFLFPLEEMAVTPTLVYWGSLYGIAEMLLSGITTFLDMYYFEDQVAQACEKAGIRGVLGETMIGQKTCDSPVPYGGLAYGEEFIQKWQGHPLVTPMVSPHATNTSEPVYLQKAFDMAETYDTPFTLHASEMDYEMTHFADNYHMTPTAFLDSLGTLSRRTLLAHCIHMTPEDLDLGTDGPSSGNTLSMFTQFRLFASFHKTVNHDRSLFTARDIVRLGTLEGARALGMESRIGSIEPGKEADLVMVERDSVNMFPCYNPYSALVYSAERSNVSRVWVAGQELVKDGALTRLNLGEIRRRLWENMGDFIEKSQEFSAII